MTRQQREAVAGMLRVSPFDPAGDLREQRPLFEKMIAAAPVPGDVATTPGRLGGVPVIYVDIPGTTTGGVIVYFHGGFFAIGRPRPRWAWPPAWPARRACRWRPSTTGSRPSTPGRPSSAATPPVATVVQRTLEPAHVSVWISQRPDAQVLTASEQRRLPCLSGGSGRGSCGPAGESPRPGRCGGTPGPGSQPGPGTQACCR